MGEGWVSSRPEKGGERAGLGPHSGSPAGGQRCLQQSLLPLALSLFIYERGEQPWTWDPNLSGVVGRCLSFHGMHGHTYSSYVTSEGSRLSDTRL